MRASRVQKVLDANQLAIEIEGELFVIPMSNVKYLRVKPAPEKLSDTAIRSGDLKYGFIVGPAGKIRTSDPLTPRQVRYQTALQPD